MPLIRSISGLRATVNDSLDGLIIQNYAKAFHSVTDDGPIVIGRDGRPSGEQIEQTLTGTLIEMGREVLSAGIVPTPTVQVLVEHFNAAGGIIITASHNPAEWNGLKFVNSNGVFFDSDENKNLWHHLDNQIFEPPKSTGLIHRIDDAAAIHIDRIMNLSIIKYYQNAIRDLNLKVVVDAVNASGSKIVPELLKRLGVEVVCINCDESGIFPHLPEPLPINLTQLAAAVKIHNASLGLAVDPDADRLVLIDENGNPVLEELTISLAVDSILSSIVGKHIYDRSVVVNLSTTRLVDDIALKHSTRVYRAPVGEINVVNKMIETNSIIGGEGSGGVILPECHYGRDSLVGIALVLSLIAIRKVPLSNIISDYPNYVIIKKKLPAPKDFEIVFQKIINSSPNAMINVEDGIRIDFANSWVQLRKSNTEPILRIIAEAPTEQIALTHINFIEDFFN